MKRKNVDRSVVARKVLDGFWQEAQLKGRCWGRKKPGNIYAGTNITIAIGDEFITISYNKELVIHEFIRAKSTKLGNRIRKALRRQKLPHKNYNARS